MRADGPEEDEKAVAADLWVTVKAKTTEKNTRRSTRQQWLFRASTHGVQLGRAPSGPACEVNDASMQPVHARIALVVPPGGDTPPYVELRVEGRTYFLVGRKGSPGWPQPLHVGSTLKLGACSLEVLDAVVAKPAVLVVEAGRERVASEGVASGGGEAEAPPPPLPLPPPSDDVCCE